VPKRKQYKYNEINPRTGISQWWHNVSKCPELTAKEKLLLLELFRRTGWHEQNYKSPGGWANYNMINLKNPLDRPLSRLVHYVIKTEAGVIYNWYEMTTARKLIKPIVEELRRVQSEG